MPKTSDYSDIQEKVKTYEDVATYYADYMNRCYEDEILNGSSGFKVLSPEELTKQYYMLMLGRENNLEDYHNPLLDGVKNIRERLEKAEEHLEKLEDER